MVQTRNLKGLKVCKNDHINFLTMKKYPIKFAVSKFMIFTFLFLSIVSCKKDDVNEDLVIDEVFPTDYIGALKVHFTNWYPEFTSESFMAVEVDKFGLIIFESGTLEYSGITEVSEDSKIERNGKWKMVPTGQLITDGGVNYMNVNAGIEIEFDETKIWAKDNYGNWVIVSEYAVQGTPNSELSFNFDEARINGSTCGVDDPFGSIIWTLTLTSSD
jgi:hypothetical protein